MVLFKRKPVQFLPPPRIDDDDTECWVISDTQEVFLSYESYLQRMDWYRARRFICEITGHSGLSFFDALRSETAGAREVEDSFPESLKEPVLRRVQFSTISRIDSLVDRVYDEFKNDFYPGEMVTVQIDDGQRLNGVVRDKAKFPEIKDQFTGEIRREAFARYFVKLVDRPNQETLVDDSKVSRDRKVFTKQMLRSFIKNTVTREAWNGAPWLVKQSVADAYRIDTDVPVHLRHGYKVAEKKERKKAEQQDGMFGIWQPNRLPELKPALKGRKSHMLPDQANAMQQQADWEAYQRAQMTADPRYAPYTWDGQMPPTVYNDGPLPHAHSHYMPYQNGHVEAVQQQTTSKKAAKAAPPPPPPPIKFPIEDMDCPPLRDEAQRPPLSFITELQAHNPVDSDDIIPGLQERTVGYLLETWNTLNVYCQVLQLDSFTFDDFIDATLFSSSDIDCELFVEIHCAVLKKLVNSENDQEGAIQISLPDLPEMEDSEEDDEEEESALPSPSPEPDVPARRTRSSLNKMALAEEVKRANSPTPVSDPHRAAEMSSADYGWIDRLRKRDFRNGGWELVMVGLLNQVAGRPRLKEVCDTILKHLAPLDAEPGIRTARVQYSTMDVNMRAEALQIICQLFLETKAVKSFLEDMSNTMTQYRKIKIEHQRARKEAIAALKILHDQRRSLAPQEKSPTPLAELEDSIDAEKIAEVDGEEAGDSEDDRPAPTRSLRRGNDRAAERKRKREAEEARKEKAKEEKANKGTKEYQRVLRAIEKEREKIAEHEEQIEIVDGDLREADAYRTRCLGKDRFCNRYWWFERNAMPYGGLPESSTAHADYANGRLWVQGPDEMERVGYIDVPEDAKNNYFRCFGITPLERKNLEEGATHLEDANQWGFYDDVESLDNLIDWLDPRGVRELKLKKELSSQRDVIAKYMENRKSYLHPVKQDSEPETKPAPTRMSTRTKTYVSEDLTQLHRCLKWNNTLALGELGYRHVDIPPPPRPRKGVKKTYLAHNEGQMQTRGRDKDSAAATTVSNRQGKLVTRQGGRYNF